MSPGRLHLIWAVAVLALVVVAAVFIDDIGGWVGMRSKAAFEQAVQTKDQAIAVKEEVAAAAELRAKDAEKTAAVAEARVAAKTAQLAQVNKTLDLIIKTRPNVTEVIRENEKLAATDPGLCALIERVLRVPCARVRMVQSCGG